MKTIIYARYSSDSQREESIEGQLRECMEYAEKNNIKITGSYIDRALSTSKNTEKRLEFQRMIKDSAKGLFNIVLVWKLDRFSRTRFDSAYYKHVLKKNNVKVVSATERITDGPEGIILESMLEGMAEFYSAELSEKIRRGQRENALKGKNNGGGVPLGYKLDENHRLIIDPLTAPIVLEIFKRYAEGETVRSIIESLNQRNLRNKKNKPFTMSSFNLILKNRKYIGEYKYKDIIIEGGVPAILPEDLFYRVKTRMDKNKRAPSRTKAEDEFILTLKLFCGKCGRMMVGESGRGKMGKVYHYYKCGSAKRKKGCTKKAVRKEWIENLVIQNTMQMIMDDVLLERLIDKLLEIQGEENHDIAILRMELSETNKGIENLVNAIQAGIITSSTKKRLENLEERKISIENSLMEAELKNPVLTREQISFFLYRFRKLDISETEHKRRIIDSFVNAVYVFDDKLVLTFNYKDGTQAISLDAVNSSDLICGAPPNTNIVKPCIL